MSFESSIVIVSLVLLFGMIAASEIGRRLARARAARDPDGAGQGVGVIDGAVFGLLGLLVAFSFSGAASRFDARRSLVIQEANAIGTAYLRLDLLPAGDQPGLRGSFRQYVDARLRAYDKLPDVVAARKEIDAANRIASAIWSSARSSAAGSQPATMLLLPALNEMFDIANTRTINATLHPPSIIYGMLFCLALASAVLGGYGMARSRSRNWLHVIGYAAVTAGAFYVILDIEHPRLGLIGVEAVDAALRDLRNSMN